MGAGDEGRGERWSDAMVAARLFAADPQAMGGVVLRARAGPLRDRWLANLRSLLPPGVPIRKLPPGIDEERLLGGLDLPATLAAGRPVAQAGLFEECDRGVLIAPMAERLERSTAAHLKDAIGSLGVVLLDEGIDDEGVAAILAERCALHVDLTDLSIHDAQALIAAPEADAPVAEDEATRALCEVAAAFGIDSARPAIQSLKVARGLARGPAIRQSDVTRAARLSLAPRARQLPAVEDAPPEPQEEREQAISQSDALREMVVDAVRAALPAGLLAFIAAGEMRGRGGERAKSKLAGQRGRRAGVRRGLPRGGARLDLSATLRAAAPWQRVRTKPEGAMLAILRDDLRVQNIVAKGGSTVIFAIDASGSAAAERMAEAKGAVELLLGEAYARRTEVALIAFRGTEAELVLPPTRSLVRARRAIGGMAGGGGTPLAKGLVAARAAAAGVVARGRTPLLIVMTDGRANIALDGSAGRGQATEDGLAAARLLRGDGVGAVLIDIASVPRAEAASLAVAMGARYLALPRADAVAIAAAVA